MTAKLLNLLKLKRIFIPATLVAILGIFVLYLFFGPISVTFHTAERLSYSQALEEFETLSSQDDGNINDKCGSILMNHGTKVTKSIVLYHGYTNCPEQFRSLGQQFFDQGYNVLIPRIPFHGNKDRLTTDLSQLTPETLSNFVKQTSQIGSGIGDEVYTAGISGGAILSATSGYYYNFINKAIIISPLFIGYDLPDWGLDPFIKIRNFMPDYYVWWDDEEKENITGPNYAYPRFSFKGSMSFMEVGKKLVLDIESSKATNNPNLKIVHITSQNDKAVKNYYNQNIIDNWANKINHQPTLYMFPASYNFNHDIIDQNQATARPDIVYPIIIGLAEAR